MFMDQIPRASKKTERGRETLFRVTYQHQSKLIQIADYKANIIISVSTMVISATIAILGYGAVAGKMADYSTMLFIPIAMIILTCLVSLVIAIQAARPKLISIKNSGNPTHRSSLLFFGVIASYTQQEYLDKMRTLLTSESDMYEQMILDIRNQGKVLRRKYNLLVYSFQILMYGFAFSVVIFLGFILFGL